MRHETMSRSTPSAVALRGAFAIAIGSSGIPGCLTAQALDSATVAQRADRVMSAVAASAGPGAAPGCAVGISHDSRPVYERAFGMADLEFSIPNTPQTIFESGSVAKQFTAAAVVLLALEGKLKLDDPVRKYIPELPDYGARLTIRHLLTHTAGIRDWGSVLALTGYGRGDRVVSQALALDVTVHQRGIDFTPGAEYSYSNSGYTLASTIVERVSGQTLPVFTAKRFFEPLGMTHSQWRDDFKRLVPGRAQAYARANNMWTNEMPFMNVYGNGGMLTTVGDWLRWNAMLETRTLGDANIGALVDSLERRGRLNDGREISYALGIVVQAYKGLREVSHGGSTAGYNTYLTRFPERKLSIAVMCNGTLGNPTALAYRFADEVLGLPATTVSLDTVTMPVAELAKRTALWRSTTTHFPLQTSVENGALRMVGGPMLRPLRDGSFATGPGPLRVRIEVGSDGKATTLTRAVPDGAEQFVAAEPWTPTAADLASFAGVWYSEEAGATFTFAVKDGQASIEQRPTTRILLRPLYRDHFGPRQGGGQVIWFTRDGGKVTTLHVGSSRLRDMPFTRVGGPRP